MLLKKQVMKTLREMPDEFTMDEAIEKLTILNKIEKARMEIKEGKGLTTAQARKKLHKWLK